MLKPVIKQKVKKRIALISEPDNLKKLEILYLQFFRTFLLFVIYLLNVL
jgi:hypothetical protein